MPLDKESAAQAIELLDEFSKSIDKLSPSDKEAAAAGIQVTIVRTYLTEYLVHLVQGKSEREALVAALKGDLALG